MEDIRITHKEKSQDGWNMTVQVGETDFHVQVDQSYWDRLRDKAENVEDLVKRSFAFLLKREQKRSILRTFNLRDIETYFPEYPTHL